jgi:hypothetical protein
MSASISFGISPAIFHRLAHPPRQPEARRREARKAVDGEGLGMVGIARKAEKKQGKGLDFASHKLYYVN